MKKIIITLLLVVLSFGLMSCGDTDEKNSEPEEVKITDCIDNITVEAVEDGVIYWDVHFNEKFNEGTFNGLDFYDCIKECFKRSESKAEGIKDYSINGYDSTGMLRFAWGYICEDYFIIHEYHEDGTAEKYEYSLTSDMYQELLDLLEQ